MLTDRRALTMIGFNDLPLLPDGFEVRFSREPNAFSAAEFGDPSILMPLFDKHRDLLIENAKRLTPETLEAPVPKPSPRLKDIGEFLLFMGMHVVVHAGQISTIRRSLGRPPLF